MNRLITVILVSLLAGSAHAQVAGNSCSGSITAGPDANGQNLQCNGSTWVAISSGVPATTQTDVTASRAIGTVYQNTTGYTLLVSVIVSTSNGTGACYNQATNGVSKTDPTTVVSGYGTTASSANNTFTFVVPANIYYHCDKLTGTGSMVSPRWTETKLSY